MATQEGGGESHLFLEAPAWVYLPGDRVRCVQTGHEMPLAAQQLYATTKKCRSALFEAALIKRTPPLNFFEQSPDAKDKIICKLTGVVLNKKEDAVWKHMMGKKFEHKLAGKEAQKEMARQDVEMKDSSLEKHRTGGSGTESRGKGKEQNRSATLQQPTEQDLNTNSDSDKSDFWMPPAGDRWDFDDGGGDDRWCSPNSANAHRVVAEPLDAGDAEMLDGEEVLDGDEGSDDDESQRSVRTKRTTPGWKKGQLKKKGKKLKQAPK